MNRILENCIKLAAQYKLYKPLEAPVTVLSNFRFVTISELLSDPELFGSLINCYQIVFGSRDIWGEGAICSGCKRIISREEYLRIIKLGNAFCTCSGVFKPIFSEEALRKRIASELNPDMYADPFCIIMIQGGVKTIVGFSWGTFDKPSKLAERITAHRFNGTQGDRLFVADSLKEEFPTDEKIHFFDELGVLKDARGGLVPVISLTRLAFEKAIEQGIRSALFWTSRKSPIYNICRLVGFVDLFETHDGIVFIYLEDIIPLTVLFQNVSPRDFPLILKGNMQYL